MTDVVNHPEHYISDNGIETIDVIEGVLGKYDHRDQVEKYNQRAHKKGNFLQDLKKARWYLDRTIANAENGILDPRDGSRIPPFPVADGLVQVREETDSVGHIYEDHHGDLWAVTPETDDWRWYRVRNGRVIHVSIHGHTFEEAEDYGLRLLTGAEAERAREIIRNSRKES